MYNNNSIRPRFGEIWMCNLYAEGSIQRGYRPVFVISNNQNNTYSPTINVIPLTSKMNKKQLPMHVEIWDYQKYGLRAPSTLLVEQISTIPIDNLTKRIGSITDTYTLNVIYRAMSIQFPILDIVNLHIAC
jgi:mRNA interferase MazF